MLHRYNVFSHDEMVCNMASKAETLDVVLASAVHKDMVAMIQEEKRLREKIKKMVGMSLELCADHSQSFQAVCADLHILFLHMCMLNAACCFH